MRTLVIGIPLPHVSFDNYSFLSAPSFFDYEAMIVESSAVSWVIQEVVSGEGEHRTHDGLPVVNGPSGPTVMGLAELLRLRGRETERFLARGGLLVCFAYPEVPVPSVDGFPGCHRYYWLPAPLGGSQWSELLVGGFGRRGVRLTDPGHPFSRYVEAYGERLAYRVYFQEETPSFAEGARVFARSPGGVAVGVEVRVGDGRVVFVPPLGDLDVSRDRIPLAQTLSQCIEAALSSPGAGPPQWMCKEASSITSREEEQS